MADHLIVITALPGAAEAERIAEALLEKRLAACVNIGAPSTSIYPWKGNIERSQEVVVTIKTRHDRLADVSDAINERHPYELPEVVAVPIIAGTPDYLAWIDTCTATS